LEHCSYGIKSSAIASPRLGQEDLLNTTSGRLQQISLTAIFEAGLPVVVSRTWQVIGSLAGAAIVDGRELELVDGGVCRWEEPACSRSWESFVLEVG
jgi:hypothetical protein